MASIRKRGTKWQAQVRRKGRVPMARSFDRKADAVAWANRVEIELEQRDFGWHRLILERLTLKDLLGRYLHDVVPLKRTRSVEAAILRAFMRDKICSLPLDRLSTSDFASYRDKRLKSVKAVTVSRELGLVQHCLTLASEEWDVPITENPLKRLRRPLIDSRRERRLRPGEYERLLESASRSRNRLILPLIVIAVETGMRQGELLRARWRQLDTASGVLATPATTGDIASASRMATM